jgi:hypothetical protein
LTIWPGTSHRVEGHKGERRGATKILGLVILTGTV